MSEKIFLGVVTTGEDISGARPSAGPPQRLHPGDWAALEFAEAARVAEQARENSPPCRNVSAARREDRRTSAEAGRVP